MQISSIQQTADVVQAEISADFGPMLDRYSSLKTLLAQQIESWQSDASLKLALEFPFSGYKQKLSDWQELSSSGVVHEQAFESAIENFHLLCKAAGHPANPAFWHKQLKGVRDNQANKDASDAPLVSSRLLSAEWQKVLDKTICDWELERIGSLRRKLTDQLKALLSLLRQLQPVIEELGLDLGLLIDLSKGRLTEQDFAELQRWASYLANDEGLKALCTLLGKVRQLEQSEKLERIKISHKLNIRIPDINSREEIVGIRLGRDLEHVLPSEKALLADADTAILFDLKYVESRLMCFDMQGMQTNQIHEEKEESRQVAEAEKPGPMVICVDTSGSMAGMPETIAKAITLFLAAKAREEHRPCYLINFSTDIEVLELTGNLGIAAVINFLKMSFHGGTDTVPALRHALEKMQEDDYKEADLLVISDFIMADLPQVLLESIEAQRGKGNRFNSLVVGDAYMTTRLNGLFDREWVYNPSTSTIHELIGFQRRLTESTETIDP